ncbi:MAG: DVUA0089 family protein [Acidobacteriia bacterium]|nr:DVUA0089 family protein [Terriglobia bacterium]
MFDSGGNFLASTFFGITCPPGAQTNTNSNQCFDVLMNGGTLAAGDYRIAISAFENLSFAENLGSGTLADGF